MLLTAGLLTTLGIAASSCGSSEGSYCSDKCDCEGCSSAQEDACVSSLQSDGNRADRLGCGNLYDNYINCLNDTGRCIGADYTNGCGTEKHQLENCIGDIQDVGGGGGCVSNTQCGGGAPFCGPNGECVECLVTTDCAVGKVCTEFHCK